MGADDKAARAEGFVRFVSRPLLATVAGVGAGTILEWVRDMVLCSVRAAWGSGGGPRGGGNGEPHACTKIPVMAAVTPGCCPAV